jgi:hypothetical protein
LFSEEMQRKQIASKVGARITHSEAFTTKSLEKAWKQYPVPLIIESHAAGSSSVDFLRQRCVEVAAGRKIVAVVVDYLALLKSHNKEKYDKLEDVTTGLKHRLAVSVGCPVWSAVQPRRNIGSNDGRQVRAVDAGDQYQLPVYEMGDISECWAIPQIVDYMVSINQNQSEKNSNPIKARLFKGKVRVLPPWAPKRDTLHCEVNYSVCEFL